MLSTLIRNWLLEPVLEVLQRVEFIVANDSQVLNDVAAVLRGSLYTSISDLLAENAALRGEDAEESAAAEGVRSAVAELGSLFAPADLPDVPAELPAEGETPEG
jgi:hypothetical protein